jgi:hypothetical protein
MRQCGRRWATKDAALRSKRHAADLALLAYRCPFGCGGWHLRAKEAATGSGPSAEMKAMTFARDLGWCVRCGTCVENIDHSCHHRWLLSQLGPNEFTVLITLCGTGTTGCHGYVHANPAESYAAGWLVRSGTDPAAVPVLRALPGGTARQYPTEDGDWADELPGQVAA